MLFGLLSTNTQAALDAAQRAENARDEILAAGVQSLEVTDTFVIGPPIDDLPVTDTTSGNIVMVLDDPAPADGFMRRLHGEAAAGGTITFKRMTKTVASFDVDGTPLTWTFEKVVGSSDYPIVIGAAGEFDIDKATLGTIPILTGEHRGFHINNIIRTKLDDVANSGGYWQSASNSGNVDSFTTGLLHTDNKHSLSAEFEYDYVTVTRVKAIQRATNDLNTRMGNVARLGSERAVRVLGRQSDPISGAPPSGAITYLPLAVFPDDGTITEAKIYANAAEPAWIRIERVAIDEDGQRTASMVDEIQIALVPGLNTFSLNLQGDAGDRVALSAGTAVDITVETISGGAVAFTAGDRRTFTLGLTSNQCPQIQFTFEYDRPGVVGSAVAMPGEMLADADRVTRADISTIEGAGESTSLGTTAVEFSEDADDYSIWSFPQFRSARPGSLGGGESQSGGNGTPVAAVEQISTVANDWAYDNDGADTDRGNTGMVRLCKAVIDRASKERGIAKDAQQWMIVFSAHGGFRLDQYNEIGVNALWTQLGIENAQDNAAAWAAQGLTVNCPFIRLTNGGNNASQGTVVESDDQIGQSLVAATKAIYKSELKEFLLWIRDSRRAIYRQPFGPHILLLQPSGYIRADGNFSGVPRDMIAQQVLIELSAELSFFHCLGPDFWCERSNQDNAHNDATGYNQASLAMERAINDIMVYQRRPRFALPLSVTLSGTTVSRYFWSPDPIMDPNDAVVMFPEVPAATNFGVSVTLNGSTTPETLAADPTLDNAPAEGWHEWVRKISVDLTATPGPTDLVDFWVGRHYGRSTDDNGRIDEATHNFPLDAGDQRLIDGVSKEIRLWLPHCVGRAVAV